MTIVQHAETSPAVPTPGSTGANLIREAAAVMVDAHKLATAVAGTQMIPKHFQNKPDELAAAMLYGASLNLDPMQSARQIYVVHGQAALYARAMDALTKGAGHETWTVETSDESVTVAGRRKGSQHVEQSTWTYERAKKAGYTNNEKYRTDPQAMLYAKALSEVCRKIAPDVLNGVYAVEELQMERWEAEVVTRPPASGAERMAGILGTKPSGPESAPDAATSVSEQSPTSGPESVLLDPRSSLAKAMFAAMRDRDINEKADRLAFCSRVVGREIGSSTELTEDEARLVLRNLDAAGAES